MIKKICLVLLMSLSCFATNVYIDTDESTGTQDGTSWSTAYDCLQDAVVDRAGVLSEDITFYYKASAGTADVNAITLTGYTLNGHNIYFVQSDFPADGKWSDSAYRLEVPDSNSVIVNAFKIANLCSVDGMQILVTQADGTYSTYGLVTDPALDSNIYLNRLIIKGNISGGAITYGISGLENSTPHTINLTNSIIYNFVHGTDNNKHAFNVGGAVNVNMYNCVVANNRIGVTGSPVVQTAKNCVSFNNSLAGYDFLYFETIEYCASDDTYEGTGNIDWDAGATDWAAAFTDYAKGDFSIKDASSVLYNAGTDLSASGVTTDIIGTARPQATTYDIGAYEYAPIVRKPRIISTN